MGSPTAHRFIVVCQQAWCNAQGYGIHYGWDGEKFPTRKEAMAHGFEIRESDDFNIAVIAGRTLLSFDWMEKSVGNDDAAMAEIAQALDLKFPPDGGGAVHSPSEQPQRSDPQILSSDAQSVRPDGGEA